ncbi:PP2C family protein-serine/threonine phosphatase [[Clostridium] aminophilum]|uniref:PP2C family protein-serine/threonine phosphatase n=1 Tax=[Clostridium] aminophilum TaxID=1526 RepID=UPI00332C3E89
MSITVDVSKHSLNKHSEYLCGDTVEMLKTEKSDVMILADGMGSGVQASILSTLTAKILGSMFAQGAKLEECVETVVNTLPVEKVRQVAYSTFTILQIFNNGEVYLVNYDNPPVIYLKSGVPADLPVTTRVISGQKIRECRFMVEKGDTLILVSDGVTHAGTGRSAYPFGWQWRQAAAYAAEVCGHSASAVRIAVSLTDRCRELYEGNPDDDTTVVCVRIIEAQKVHIMTGPPRDADMDPVITREFMEDPDAKKIVSGGTTATIVSREIGKLLTISLDYMDPDIPPTANMEGVDLVTEGILTLRRVVELLEKYRKLALPSAAFFRELDRKNAASVMAKMLIEECTDLTMFIGTAVNSAYQNPDLPIDLGIRQALTKRLVNAMRGLGKRVTVKYY